MGQSNSKSTIANPSSARPLCNLELECGCLGAAMMVRAQAVELIRDGSPELFTISFTQDIFAAICAVGPDALDYTLLADELERNGKHIDFGALTLLDHGVVVEIPMAKRIARLRELHRLRQLCRLGEWLASAPFEYGKKSSDLIAEVRSRLEAVEK